MSKPIEELPLSYYRMIPTLDMSPYSVDMSKHYLHLLFRLRVMSSPKLLNPG